MAAITYDHATLQYPGAASPAVSGLDLDIDDGELLVLVGPSGCGKSSALRMLAGLEEVTEGSIRIGGKDVTHLPSRERNVAMVFQNYALYPHMTVADNIGFPLKLAGMKKDEINRRVQDAARILDLEQELERKPASLSGGQRQRVAMGRAIVRHPQAFLMDEPLSNLDPKLRAQTRSQIAFLQRRLGVTTVYVTHDQAEAMTMGDRVAVLQEGRLQQVDTPRNLYDRPANVFVAGFIGLPAMNLVDVQLTDAGATLAGHGISLPGPALAALGREGARTATLGFRAESVEMVGAGEGLPLEVAVVEEIGSGAFAYGTLGRADGSPGTDDKLMVIRVDPGTPPAKGETVHVRIRAGEEHVFSPDTGQRVPRDER
jgi:multiple sugar transport system ATP-binding protein